MYINLNGFQTYFSFIFFFFFLVCLSFNSSSHIYMCVCISSKIMITIQCDEMHEFVEFGLRVMLLI